MNWSNKAWDAIIPIFNAITNHPFINELMDGSLSKERFEFFIYQDALYLKEFGKSLSMIASKFDNPTYMNDFLGFAKDTVSVEKILHEIYLPELAIVTKLKQSPSCLLYTSFMRSQISSKSLGEAISTVLPCFWIYKQVGEYIVTNQTKNFNPYQNWINTYAGEEFGIAVNKAIAICDEISEQYNNEIQENMIQAFITATKMEWMFWDSAYNLEHWKI